MNTDKTPDESNGRSRSPNCPFCGASAIAENEPGPMKNNGQSGAYRRRRTYACNGTESHKFTTDESLSFGMPMLVKKKDGRLESFDYSRLLTALNSAATPHQSGKEIDKLARKVTDAAYQKAEILRQGKVVNSNLVGELVLDTLKLEDRVAMWIRFSLIFHGFDRPGVHMKVVLDKLRIEWSNAS